METFSALMAICVGNSPVTGDFPAQRSETQSFDVLNGWVHNHDAGDLRRHRTHYDVTVIDDENDVFQWTVLPTTNDLWWCLEPIICH